MATVDRATLADLAAFARAELAAGDIEPWAVVLAECRTSGWLTGEGAAWAVKCYNAYDDLGSAFRLLDRWPGPTFWATAPDTTEAASWGIGHERRNLRGGKIIRHLDSYVTALRGEPQLRWLGEVIVPGTDPGQAFDALMSYMRALVWGTGRQSAFEWAEFAGKALGVPVNAGHGCLWESSGPRESLERIYNGGQRAPSQAWLDGAAAQCRDHLASEGAPLEWWDLETVICDFNVMRKGRYYPGKHLAMIREEIDGLPEPARGTLLTAFRMVIPEPWNGIAPGADKGLQRAYAATGRITTPFGPLEEAA